MTYGPRAVTSSRGTPEVPIRLSAGREADELAVAIIDTHKTHWHSLTMASRQTLNVSLPSAQESFVRAQVENGRYRTASEVVREGLRLLEQAEHRRLLEKWIYQDLTPEELALLPEQIKQRARDHFRGLLDEARRDIGAGRVVDGPNAIQRLREEIEARRG